MMKSNFEMIKENQRIIDKYFDGEKVQICSLAVRSHRYCRTVKDNVTTYSHRE